MQIILHVAGKKHLLNQRGRDDSVHYYIFSIRVENDVPLAVFGYQAFCVAVVFLCRLPLRGLHDMYKYRVRETVYLGY